VRTRRLPTVRPLLLLRAAVLAAGGLYAGVLVSGMGLMSGVLSSASAYEYQYGHKTVVCHNGQTIVVDDSSLNKRLAKGDTLGPCP
jgi:hypothetical protein